MLTDQAFPSIRNPQSAIRNHVVDVLVILAISLVAQGIAFSAPQGRAVICADSAQYQAAAEALLDPNGTPHFELRKPGYPLFLAGVKRMFGQLGWAAIVCNHALALLLPLAAYGFGVHLHSRPLGWLAAGLTIVRLQSAVSPNRVMSEVLYTVLLSFGLLVFVVGLRRPRAARWLAAAGALIGAAWLTRGTATAVIPVALVAIVWVSRKSFRRIVVLGTVFVLPIVGAAGLECALNTVSAGQFRPATGAAGASMWGTRLRYFQGAPWPQTNDARRLRALLPDRGEDEALVGHITDAWIARYRAIHDEGWSEWEFDGLCRGIATAAVRADPGAYLRHTARMALCHLLRRGDGTRLSPVPESKRLPAIVHPAARDTEEAQTYWYAYWGLPHLALNESSQLVDRMKAAAAQRAPFGGSKVWSALRYWKTKPVAAAMLSGLDRVANLWPGFALLLCGWLGLNRTTYAVIAAAYVLDAVLVSTATITSDRFQWVWVATDTALAAALPLLVAVRVARLGATRLKAFIGPVSLVACPVLLVAFLAHRYGLDWLAVARAVAMLYFLGVIPGFVVQRYVFRLSASSPFEMLLSSLLLGVLVSPLVWYGLSVAGLGKLFAPVVAVMGIAVPFVCRWHRGIPERVRQLVGPADALMLWLALLLTIVWSWELAPVELRDGKALVMTPLGDHCVYAAWAGEFARGVPPEGVPFIAGIKRWGAHFMAIVWCDLLRRVSGLRSLDAYFYLALPLRYVLVSLGCYLALVGRFGRWAALAGTACLLGFALYPNTDVYFNGLLTCLHFNYTMAFGVLGLFLVIYYLSRAPGGNCRALLLLGSMLSGLLLWYKANHALPIIGAVAMFSAWELVRRRDLRWLVLCLGVQAALLGACHLSTAASDVHVKLVMAPWAFVRYWWDRPAIHSPIWWEPPGFAVLAEGTTRAAVAALPGLLQAPAMLALCLLRCFPVAICISLYLVVACRFARFRGDGAAFDRLAVLFIVCCVAGFVVFPIQEDLPWMLSPQIFVLVNALALALMGPAVCDAIRRVLRRGRIAAVAGVTLLAVVFVWNGLELRSTAFWRTRSRCAVVGESLYACLRYVESSTPIDSLILQPEFAGTGAFVPATSMLTQRRMVLDSGRGSRPFYDTGPIMADLATFYETPDPSAARSVLERYGPDYVVARVTTMPVPPGELGLTPVFSHGDMAVFRTVEGVALHNP